jgi:hypothetical protein
VAQSTDTDRSLVFIITITVLWVGGFVVSVNAILLGGHMYAAPPLTSAYTPICSCGCRSLGPERARRSVFACVSVMGYCLAPLDAAAIACLAWNDPVFRICAVAGGFAWSLFGTVSARSSPLACGGAVRAVCGVCVSCYAHVEVVAKQRHGGSW